MESEKRIEVVDWRRTQMKRDEDDALPSWLRTQLAQKAPLFRQPGRHIPLRNCGTTAKYGTTIIINANHHGVHGVLYSVSLRK